MVECHIKTSLYFNSQESQSRPFRQHCAVGLDGKTQLTTSATNNLTKMKSQWMGEVKPAVELLYKRQIIQSSSLFHIYISFLG